MHLMRYLDGPAFVAFLESEGISSGMLGSTQQRKWSAWKKGVRADSMSDTVDQLLTRYGLPHSYIPDECWASDQRNHQSRTGPRKRRTTRK